MATSPQKTSAPRGRKTVLAVAITALSLAVTAGALAVGLSDGSDDRPGAVPPQPPTVIRPTQPPETTGRPSSVTEVRERYDEYTLWSWAELTLSMSNIHNALVTSRTDIPGDADLADVAQLSSLATVADHRVEKGRRYVCLYGTDGTFSAAVFDAEDPSIVHGGALGEGGCDYTEGLVTYGPSGPTQGRIILDTIALLDPSEPPPPR